MPRSSSVTDERVEQVRLALESGDNLSVACRTAGVSRTTLLDRIGRDAALEQTFVTARAVGAAFRATQPRRRAAAPRTVAQPGDVSAVGHPYPTAPHAPADTAGPAAVAPIMRLEFFLDPAVLVAQLGAVIGLLADLHAQTEPRQ